MNFEDIEAMSIAWEHAAWLKSIDMNPSQAMDSLGEVAWFGADWTDVVQLLTIKWKSLQAIKARMQRPSRSFTVIGA